MKGIDVSKHNGKIDWSKVDASGIDFALIRAGYGNDISQKDPMFDAHVQGALAHKLHVGAYWFSYAISADDARKEAKVFQQILAPYKGKIDFPVAFDYEYASMEYSKKQGVTSTNALINSIARAFLDNMKADGWFVNIYTNLDFIRTGRFSSDTLAKYDVWLADYSGGPDYPCGIQQTGSTGAVPGIEGNVDMDVAMKDYPTIIKAGGYNGYPKPTILNFKSDTTCDMTIKHGGFYQLKITSLNGTEPQVTAGTSNVVTVLPRYVSGRDHYIYLCAVGAPGSGTGIYVNGKKQFVVNVK